MRGAVEVATFATGAASLERAILLGLIPTLLTRGRTHGSHHLGRRRGRGLLHGFDIEHSLLRVVLGSCLAGFIERLHVHPPHRDLLPQSTSRPWLHSCCGTARRRRLLLVVTSFVDAAATATLGLSSPRISIIRTLACDIQWPWDTLQALLVLVLMVVLVLLLMLLLLLLLLLVMMLQLVLLLMLLLQVRRRAKVFPSR